MKLKSLKISEFRKFTDPVQVHDLAPGLNLLHGANETGKSTLAQALRTAFFEKHNTKGKFVQVISPTGFSDAAPSIDVEFLIGDTPASLHKRFFKKPRAQLRIGTHSWENSAADEELARRLGFSLPGSGASRESDRGIPGLLWIEQGHSPELGEPIGHARASLQERLKDIIGEVTSSNGRQVIEAVSQELGKLRTPNTGKDSGVLRDTASQLQTARDEQAGLQQKLNSYRDKVDALGQALDTHRQQHREQPWVQLERKRDEAKQRLQALLPRQRELDSQRNALTVMADRIEDLTGAHDQRQQALGQLQMARVELERLAAELLSAENGLKQAEAEQASSTGRRDAAKAALATAQRHAQRRQLHSDVEQVKGELERVSGVVERAAALQGEIARTRTDAAAVKLDTDELQQLRELDTGLRELQIQLEAVATRIDFRLLDGHQVHADAWGEVRGQSSHHATAPVTLKIEGVGEIDVVPGADTVRQVAEERDHLQDARRALLARMGVPDLAAAEARHQQWQALTQQLGQMERELQIHLAGQSLLDCTARRDELAGRHRGLVEQLAGLQEDASPPTSLQEAEQSHQQAQSDLETAAQARAGADKVLLAAKLAHQSLATTIASESERLESEPGRARFEAMAAELEQTRRNADATRAAITALETELRDMNPEGLQQDADRFETSHRVAIQRREELDQRIRDLSAFLKAQGAEGLDEQFDQVTARVAQLEKRLEQYRLRADGLQLLAGKLAAHQTSAKERLYAPLRAKLEPYLKIVFPDQVLHVGIDDLAPIDLQRGEQRLGIEEFSHGTREQLGVLARFAYADLLRDANQPTLLVLDDALVHSDATRLEKMKQAVHRAAQRHQVLLFTCHPQLWLDAGADRLIDVAALGSAT